MLPILPIPRKHKDQVRIKQEMQEHKCKVNNVQEMYRDKEGWLCLDDANDDCKEHASCV